jgi:hypothetical protein
MRGANVVGVRPTSDPAACPFCEWSITYATEIVIGGGWCVRCGGCQAAGPVSLTRESAVERWNKVSNYMRGSNERG